MDNFIDTAKSFSRSDNPRDKMIEFATLDVQKNSVHPDIIFPGRSKALVADDEI